MKNRIKEVIKEVLSQHIKPQHTNHKGGPMRPFLFILLITINIFGFNVLPTQASQQLVINEIFPNPAGSDADKEFVEIYNPTDDKISLQNYFIRRTSLKGVIKKYYFQEEDKIDSQEYLVLKTDSLNNNGATIELILQTKEETEISAEDKPDNDTQESEDDQDTNDDENNNDNEADEKNQNEDNNETEILIDSVKYSKAPDGQSYNRKSIIDNEWYWAKPTPGEINEEDPADKQYPLLQLSELLPNPEGEETIEEYIELYNPNDFEVDLTDWQLRDSSKTGKYNFPTQTNIAPKNFLTIYRKDFKFALNNTGLETVTLFAPNDKIQSQVNYKDAQESLSYSYNPITKQWQWTQYQTPNSTNKFNHKPTFIVDIPTNGFTYQPIKMQIKDLQDENNDNITVEWEFGDNSKKQNGLQVEHIYQTPGQYTIIVIIRDAVEAIQTTQKIEIIQEPLPKLEIVGLLPNPTGADTGQEEITIKNNDTKTINLQNFKIATGRDEDSLVKHIISEQILINPRQTITLKNNSCKFVLINSQSVVELLFKDDRLIDKISYQEESVPPGERYVKENNEWIWEGPYSNNHPPEFEIKKPKKVYKNVYAEFEIEELYDPDDDDIKVVWDFGDGHKSYLTKTRHKYEKKGKYKVTVKVKDGKTTVKKDFTIKVKKYPKYKLQIVGLLPNPIGKDYGKEVIFIKNNENKKINLKNYFIAIGKTKEKLTRHPFYKNFILKAGEIKKLFNSKITKFSLLNKQGIVQLLYPNGKVASEVAYEKKKILPGEEYLFNNSTKQWWWTGGESKKTTDNNLKLQNKYTDITLSLDQKMCLTQQYIKKQNFLTQQTQHKISGILWKIFQKQKNVL